MSDVKNVPEVVVYTRDKREILGTLKGCTEISKDINFNAASELSLTVADRNYDDVSETWIKNPLYEKLEENIVLYLNDDTKYFSYPARQLWDSYVSGVSWKTRSATSMTYSGMSSSRWTIKDETELFDIGSSSGYTFKGFTSIQNTESSTQVGAIVEHSISDNNVIYVACETFVPVSAGDVISYNRYQSGKKYWDFCFFFYTDADASTFTGLDNIINSGNWASPSSSYPIRRHIITSEQLGGNDSGYVRVSLNLTADAWSKTKISNGYRYTWYSPKSNYIKIYSGERKCKSANVQLFNDDGDSYSDFSCKWFVITDVEENSNGIYNTKTITAKSYEYTLNKRCFSLSANTLALYTPPDIIDLVNNEDEWYIDRYLTTLGGGVYGRRGSQHMEQGLLNQILDCLPNWKMGNISPELMSTYRTFEDVDNANVYNFLMNDIQSTYQCFIVFDNEEQTISAYTWEDMLDCYDKKKHFSNRQMLTWDNAVKELNITNSDSDYVTALQVHTGDDLYSISLVNPTGNNVIYNFDYVENDMKFEPDYTDSSNVGTADKTLYGMLDYWKYAYSSSGDNYVTTTVDGQLTPRRYFTEYREAGKAVIEYTLSITKLETRLAEALAEYRSVADKINVGLDANAELGEKIYTGFKLTDKPLTTSKINSYFDGYGAAVFYTESLYKELLSCANSYWDAYNELQEQKSNLTNYQDEMKNIASRLTFKPSKGRNSSYSTSVTTSSSVPPNVQIVLTEKQLLALDKFIYEGVWTDEGATFSDTYDADDIYNTLVSVYDNAVADLADRLSFPTYEFSITTANIVAVPELAQLAENLTVGSPIYLENPKGGWYKPVLLSVHINYKDDTDFSMNFSTDFKKKPLELRFNSLFGTINQTSTQTSEFTYDD